MTDDNILDVIGERLRLINLDPLGRLRREDLDAAHVLAALRDADLEIVPTDTARLGQAVQATEYATGSPARIVLDVIYAEAGVERP